MLLPAFEPKASQSLSKGSHPIPSMGDAVCLNGEQGRKVRGVLRNLAEGVGPRCLVPYLSYSWALGAFLSIAGGEG